jgi:hypothetical protein
MKKATFIFAFIFASILSNAQPTTAMDFTADDCNGNMHNLFTTLDSGEVVILEYFMNCPSCIQAGQKITPMFNSLDAAYPGRVNYYAFTFNNTMTCATANSVISGNGINAVPFDSGAAQVSYYGGFGMPTIVVAAGTSHGVLFSNVGFTLSDTTTMGIQIRNFFATIGVNETVSPVTSMNVFPNPSQDEVQLDYELANNSAVTLQIVNSLGQLVRETPLGEAAQGQHTTTVNVSDLSAGVYCFRMNTAEGVTNRQIIISR